jgi:hypothetical protein
VRSEGALRCDDGFVVFKERFDSESTVFSDLKLFLLVGLSQIKGVHTLT